MEKNNTKLFLEVDATQIDIKQLFKQDFLELSMKAISSANPNRNNSWFTKESMEKSIGSFINKPILGYFENGDFVSHNGEWEHDSEVGMDYWDTLGKKGERILGIIRESDEVKIVEDNNGLSWVVFTCALWTQYSFKQVKRLIKDAKRAQKTGESTKNISVEVDITDYEILDNGVMKINEFNLVGVTILGTRNGVKVEPGIEDAELSVVDIMGRDVYSLQEKSLRLAYEKLNNSVMNEEESQVEKEENKKPENSENLSAEEEIHKDDLSDKKQENLKEDKDGICPECGKNPCECDQNVQKEEENPEDKKDAQENMDKKLEEDDPEDKGDDHDDDDDNDDKDDEHEDDKKSAESAKDCGDNCAYSITSDNTSAIVVTPTNTEAVIAVASDYKVNLYEVEKDPKFIELKEKYEALSKEKEALSKELEEVKAKVQSYEHKEFLEKAYALIKTAKLTEEITLQFSKACEDNEIVNLEDLKTKIGLALFEIRSAESTKEGEEEKISFNAPVNKPDTDSAFDKKESKKAPKDIWEKLHEYNSK